jgi:hypothetical protein
VVWGHQSARDVVTVNRQRGLRTAILEPGVIAAVDLNQLAQTRLDVARRQGEDRHATSVIIREVTARSKIGWHQPADTYNRRVPHFEAFSPIPRPAPGAPR